VTFQIVGQQVPEDFAQTLRDVRRDQPKRLSHLLRVANEAGWTLTALAEPLGVTREAVRIRIKLSDHPRNLPAPTTAVPLPPKSRAELYREESAERARQKLKPCGTRAAYARHLYHGEVVCEACLQANNENFREERAVHSRARSRALGALSRAHTALFNTLHAAEQERESRRTGGLWDVKAKDRARQAAYRALARELPEEFEPLLAAELDWERQAEAS
jgi:hypothetical protein